ncbi:MAG: response regulator [Gorillibacterium sp.]|nr:response regulator [Gorillibacterium sp.]
MLNVMIIDDEERIRLGLAKLVEQVGENVKITGIYSNGQELLDNLDLTNVDLIITDIKMPQMSGLELIEKVQQLRPAVKFAVVSGFNDFAFARSAIRLGVEEYLLKPVETADLAQLLLRVTEKLNKEGNRQSAVLDDYYRLLLSSAPERLPDQLRLEACQELEDLPLFLDHYTAIVIHAQSDQVNARIGRIVEGWARETKIVSWEVDITVVIASIGSGDYGDTARNLGMTLLQAMPANVRVRMGVSGLFASPSTLRECYKQAKTSLQYAWYDSGIRACYSADQLPKRRDDPSVPHRLIDREFRSVLRMLDIERANTAISTWLEEISQQRPLWHNLKEYCSLVQGVVHHEKLERNLITPGSEEEPAEWLPQLFSDWEAYSQAFLSWVQTQFRVLKDTNQENRVVENIKSFIHEHYTEELELHQLAEVVYLTPSYLSKMFRTKTGETITDYIISVRMEQAKKLLCAEYGLKTYEVGQKVGYSDPAYFNKVFKKVVGLTPKEYRDRVRS